MAAAPHRQILALDLVRFLAALLVVLLHFSVFAFGWVGVQIFFVLSGFVIVYSAEGSTPAQFFISRFVRLVPAAWLSATATLLIWLSMTHSPRELIVAYLHSIVFWPSPPWIDIVYWTLHVEVGFYAVVFLALACASFRAIGGVMIAIGLWSAIFNIVVAPAIVPSWLEQVTMARFGCDFALGVLLREITCKKPPRWKALLIPVFVAGCLFEIAKEAAANGERLLDPGLCFLVVCLLIYGGAAANPQVSRWLGTFARPIRAIGLTTYPLYLLHYSVRALIYRFMPGAHSGQWDAVVIVAIIGLAAAVALVVEPPIKRPMRRWLERAVGMVRRPDHSARGA